MSALDTAPAQPSPPAPHLVAPPGRLCQAQSPQWHPQSIDAGGLPLLGQDRGAPAHLVGGAHRRRAAGVSRYRGRALPRLPHRVRRGVGAADRHRPRAAAARPIACNPLPLSHLTLRARRRAERPRHIPGPALSSLAHALARHPERPGGALDALRLDLPLEHPAHSAHARLDHPVAGGDAAARALQRNLFRRQGLRLSRPLRPALQALLAGLGQRHPALPRGIHGHVYGVPGAHHRPEPRARCPAATVSTLLSAR